jgi:hypothetical protein
MRREVVMTSRRVTSRPDARWLVLTSLLGACACERDATRGYAGVAVAAAQTPSTTAFQEATERVLPSVVLHRSPRRPTLPRTPFDRVIPEADVPLLPLGSGSGVVFRDAREGVLSLTVEAPALGRIIVNYELQ